MSDLREAEAKTHAVHKYTEEANTRFEERYRSEIAALKRQLSNSQESRDYENEVFHDHIDKLKLAQQVRAIIMGNVINLLLKHCNNNSQPLSTLSA